MNSIFATAAATLSIIFSTCTAFEIPEQYAFPTAGETLKLSGTCGSRTALWCDEKPDYLIVYFHGLASTEFEPFMLPSARNSICSMLRSENAKTAILSINLDVAQSVKGGCAQTKIDPAIRRALQITNAEKIILCGGSLGAYRALSYLSEIPSDIAGKVTGVLAIEPMDNLIELKKVSSAKEVVTAMEKLFASTPESYFQKRTIQQLLKNSTIKPKIYLVSALGDTVVPTHMQGRLAEFFKGSGYPLKVLEIGGNHRLPNAFLLTDAVPFMMDSKVSPQAH
jgi:predicted esterase